MDDNKRTELIRSGWEIHRAVEERYLDHPAVTLNEAVKKPALQAGPRAHDHYF